MNTCCIIGCKTTQKKITHTIKNLNIPLNLRNYSEYVCRYHYRYYKFLGKRCNKCNSYARHIRNYTYLCNKHYYGSSSTYQKCSVKECKHKASTHKINEKYVCNTHRNKHKYKNSECSIYGCHNKMAIYKQLYMATDSIKEKNSGLICNKHYRRYKLNIIKYLKKKLYE